MSPLELSAAVVALLVLAVLFAVRGVALLRRFAAAREHRDAPFWLVRGGRGLIVAIACACIAGGLWAEVRGLTYFGLGFLAEELYETGVVLLILRGGRRREERGRRPVSSSSLAIAA
jgi:hypothetical protein